MIQSVFPKALQKLLLGSLSERKSWLDLLRAARESINDIQIQNEFTDPESNLRKWVGL